jgi:hypothetical protein
MFHNWDTKIEVNNLHKYRENIPKEDPIINEIMNPMVNEHHEVNVDRANIVYE